MFKKIRQALQRPVAPIQRPKGVAGLLYDFGQWLCDNTSAVIVGTPTIYLILYPLIPH